MQITHPSNGKVLFAEHEIRSKGNGEIRLAIGFDTRLIDLRLDLDLPMIVTSFCRDPDHNRREGGHKSSAHLTHNSKWIDRHGEPLGTFGLDVAFPDGIYLGKIIHAGWTMGWSIGINFKKQFVHLDCRTHYTGLPQTMFGY